ncbi:hypothetical protein Vadar_029395 [Vaccinium darrowii]|uniref:Uncharacterized protein n=1 Tax=Vaccinium darrowii TaxID=229202 RepID=A0ACB7Y9G9_9ERIC|nr:hypothetical protein Vadar_029395 [Vaccinium darrowii]
MGIVDQRRLQSQQWKRFHQEFYSEGEKGQTMDSETSSPTNSTLQTIAIDSNLKNRVKSDLESFLRSKQYYNRLGRVWKQSYLLYGSSGTRKSSFVATMAKFLSHDVYDVDLLRLSDGTDLKMLWLQTRRRAGSPDTQ